jgi:hypothetical protein
MTTVDSKSVGRFDQKLAAHLSQPGHQTLMVIRHDKTMPLAP